MNETLVIRFKRSVKEGWEDLKEFGPGIAMAKIRWIMSNEAPAAVYKRNERLLQYLENHHRSLIDRYKEEPVHGAENEESVYNKTIWTMWWQGLDQMPEIISNCMLSKEKAFHGKLVILTKDNLHEFLEVPETLQKRLEEKKIKLAHFADIIRIMVLERYGGIWLDASIFCLTDVSDAVFKNPFFSIKSALDKRYVSECRWTTFAIGGSKNNILFRFLSDFFMEYLKTGKPFIDYFMFDCAIMMAYRNIPAVKQEIDCLEMTDGDSYWLTQHLQDPAEQYKDRIDDMMPLQKLAWQGLLKLSAEEGSLYGYLLGKLKG